MEVNTAKAQNLAARVAAQPYWYHKIDLGGELVTPGWAPMFPKAYGLPEDLSGKRVLDIGAWDGYWSFEAARRGASFVLAIEDFSDAIDTDHATRKDEEWKTFDLCCEALGYLPDEVDRLACSAYEIPKLIHQYGQFDVVFCFGVLYHCRHPLLLLEQINRVLVPGGKVHVETAIADDFSPYRGGHGHGYGEAMVAEFYPGSEYGNQPTNWWVPTTTCLAGMLAAAGFDAIETWKLDTEKKVLPFCRGFAEATKA